MVKLEKEIARLSAKEKEVVHNILVSLDSGNTHGFDIKKLRGHDDIFRVRKGDIRVIFRIVQGEYIVVGIKRRNEKTYRDL